MRDWDWKNALIGVFLVVILLVVPAIMVGAGYEKIERSTAHGVPKIDIVLNDASMEDIAARGKEVKYCGNDLKIMDAGSVWEYTDVEVKGRGNATWWRPKKPLQFKLNEKADLLGLGRRRKWILLANYIDTTNLRTDIAFYVERMLGEPYAYSGEFVDLYVNHKYEGLYYLTRGIEVGKNSVDLKDSLGVLVELDNVYCRLEAKCYTTGNGESFSVKDAVVKENADAAMNDFLASFNGLEVAIKNNDYKEIERLVDMESFVRYYLLSEFLANTDAYFTSHYFYKDGPSDKIHAGPAWDFDISLNNSNVFGPDYVMTRREDYNEYSAPEDQYYQWSKLFARLIEMPEFQEAAKELYTAKMVGHEDALLEHITSQGKKIRSSALRDGKKWDKNNYDEEVERLLRWVDERYDYFDQEYSQDFWRVV